MEEGLCIYFGRFGIIYDVMELDPDVLHQVIIGQENFSGFQLSIFDFHGTNVCLLVIAIAKLG